MHNYRQHMVVIAWLWLLLGLAVTKSQKAVQSSHTPQTPEPRRAAGTIGVRGFSTQMSCDLSYSRGKWKADDSIQSTIHPYPLYSPQRTANQLPEISIPVSCLVLFSPAAHQISESTCAFKWCPLELS